MPPLALDRTLHAETRLAILTFLRAAGSPVEFSTLREELGLSGGNLLSHLRALEQSGVVRHAREAPLGRARTVYAITDDGVARLKAYARTLREIAAALEAEPGEDAAQKPLA